MAAAGPAGLQALLLMPSTPGKHPLAILTNPSLGNREDKEMGPGILEPEGMWFARRNWAVVIVLRRGYGDSGGRVSKAMVQCGGGPQLKAIGDEDASDLRAAYESLRAQPAIDGNEVIAVGDSTGGVAAVSFGLDAPPGLRAVISFSGYWPPSYLTPKACKSSLAFGPLDKDVQVHMLWIYAKNDALIGRKDFVRTYESFTAAGGHADLVMLGSSGNNGHFIFSDSPQLWGPVVENFLAQHGLPSTAIFPEPPASHLKLPAGYSVPAQAAFARFQTLGGYKTFAIAPSGHWAYSSGKKSAQLADEDTLSNCHAWNGCVVYARGVP